MHTSCHLLREPGVDLELGLEQWLVSQEYQGLHLVGASHPLKLAAEEGCLNCL